MDSKPSLEDSTEFIEDISIKMDKTPKKVSNNKFIRKTNNVRLNNRNMSKINLELQSALKKTKIKARNMSWKASLSLIFHKITLIVLIILNLVGGVMFQKQIKYAEYISYTVAGFLSILAVFNLQKQGLAQVKASGDLKRVIRKIELALMQNNLNTKANNLFKIKKDLAKLDFIIFKADYGVDYDDKNI